MPDFFISRSTLKGKVPKKCMLKSKLIDSLLWKLQFITVWAAELSVRTTGSDKRVWDEIEPILFC
jgi:hypothetical protein